MRDVRRRSILAALGIPLWIPRLAKTNPQKVVESASQGIWRQQGDEVVQDNIVDSKPHNDFVDHVKAVKPAAAVENLIEHHQSAEASAGIRNVAAKKDDAVSSPISQPAEPLIQPLQVPLPETILDYSLVESQEVVAPETLRFSVQAVEINQWVILMDEKTLKNKAEKQLWNNILQAFGGPAMVPFAWPLADGARWQHPLGAKAALNGFLFRMGMDKRIGLMGELNDEVCPDRIERLPTLKDLLEEPLNKRALWNLLKVK